LRSPSTAPGNDEVSSSRAFLSESLPEHPARCQKALDTLEPEGQKLQWVMPGLMGMKNILTINDEGHHRYREKPGEADRGNRCSSRA
jgi:hypothetical protein